MMEMKEDSVRKGEPADTTSLMPESPFATQANSLSN